MEAFTFLGLLTESRTPGARADELGEATPYHCRTRLLTVTTVEAATAVVARVAALAGDPLPPIVEAWAARTPNPVTRAACRARGRELLRMAREKLPDLDEHTLPRAVAIGVVAAEAGIGAEDLVRLIAFDEVQSTLETASHGDAAVWSATLMPAIKDLAKGLCNFTRPEQIPATGAAVFHSFSDARKLRA